MRIVFNKATGAILAANQNYSGSAIVDPTAVQVLPSYNSNYHSSFTLDSGYPSDLISNFYKYMVDNTSSPTTVLPKYHLEVSFSSGEFNADGVTQIVGTISVKDSNENPATSGQTKTLALISDGAYLQENSAQFTATTSTFTMIAGLEAKQINVSVVDSNLDPITGIPGLIPSFPSSLLLVAPNNVSTSLSNVSASLKAVRWASITFNDGTHFINGMGNISVDGVEAGADELEGQMTTYPAVGVASFGIKNTTLAQLTADNFQSLYARIKTMNVATQRWWIGMFYSSPMLVDVPVSSIGFRFSVSASDTNWQCYYNDGVNTTLIGTGVAVTNNTMYGMEILYNNILNGGTLTFLINNQVVGRITGVASAGIFSAKKTLGLISEMYNLDAGAGAGIKLSAIELKYN